MATIMRATAVWSGFVGSPGYTNLYFRDFTGSGNPDLTQAQGASDRTRTFFEAIKAQLPTTVTVTMAADVAVLEETTGQLQDSFGTTPGAPTVGTASVAGGYSGATGAVVTLRTSSFRNGRRIRGRFFIVPLGGTIYGPDGTLSNTPLGTMRTAATALVDTTGTPDLGVWARPTPILDSQGNPTGNYNPDGEWAVCTSATIPDMAAVLRSRRD